MTSQQHRIVLRILSWGCIVLAAQVNIKWAISMWKDGFGLVAPLAAIGPTMMIYVYFSFNLRDQPWEPADPFYRAIRNDLLRTMGLFVLAFIFHSLLGKLPNP